MIDCKNTKFTVYKSDFYLALKNNTLQLNYSIMKCLIILFTFFSSEILVRNLKQK